jgi:hypothetical protein
MTDLGTIDAWDPDRAAAVAIAAPIATVGAAFNSETCQPRLYGARSRGQGAATLLSNATSGCANIRVNKKRQGGGNEFQRCAYPAAEGGI